MFILLELTKERSTCQAVINALNSSGQPEAAKALEDYNKSSGPMPYTYEEELEVRHCLYPKRDMSNCYNLLKKVRGKAIIFNTMEDPPNPEHSLKKETNRFRHLFEKLHFYVKVFTKMSAKQFKESLIEITKDESLEEDEAFILMVITHGQNEQVFGSIACDLIEKKVMGLAPNDDIEVQQEIDKDVIGIQEIIGILAECEYLKSKPKLFCFTCCRDRIEEPGNNNNLNSCLFIITLDLC